MEILEFMKVQKEKYNGTTKISEKHLRFKLFNIIFQLKCQSKKLFII